jgi:hypothetical protein
MNTENKQTNKSRKFYRKLKNQEKQKNVEKHTLFSDNKQQKNKNQDEPFQLGVGIGSALLNHEKSAEQIGAYPLFRLFSFHDTFYQNLPRYSSESERLREKGKKTYSTRERRRIYIPKTKISVKNCPLSIMQQSQKEKRNIEKYENQRENVR